MSSQVPTHDVDQLGPHEVDRLLRAFAVERNSRDYTLGELLRRGDDLEIHRLFGYASMREYCDRVLGLGDRAVEDRIRVARTLRDLPRLTEGMKCGDWSFSVVREVCRVATADTETEWIETVGDKAASEVARMVAGRERGERPGDPPPQDLGPKWVKLKLSPEAFALLEDARRCAVERTGEQVDDSAFIAQVMLAYLSEGATRDAGRATYQIALTVDAHRGAFINAGGESVPVSETVLAMARCDAQELGRIDGEGPAGRASQTIPPKTRRQVALRHHERCAVPGCRNSIFDVHHLDLRSEGGGHDPERLITLCFAHHEAAHRGALEIRGRFSEGFLFLHADGRPYGSAAVDPRCADVMSQAFEALRSTGYRHKEAQRMLDAVRTSVRDDASMAEVVELALKSAPIEWATCVREPEIPYLRCA